MLPSKQSEEESTPVDRTLRSPHCHHSRPSTYRVNEKTPLFSFPRAFLIMHNQQLSPISTTKSISIGSSIHRSDHQRATTRDNHHRPHPSYQPLAIETTEETRTEAISLSTTSKDNVVSCWIIKSPASSQNASSSWRITLSFWILGLLNNVGYVIMIAAAKSISEGGTALVFLANILPGLLLKASAPYWFDKVPYLYRLRGATLSMMLSFGLVAASSSEKNNSPSSLAWQLVGVAFASLQGALGEASLLALAGKLDGLNLSTEETCSLSSEDEDDYPPEIPGTLTVTEDRTIHSSNEHSPSGRKGQCLTSFSSGTGFAGVFGFFWKWLWNDYLDLSLSVALWLAMLLAVLYWVLSSFVTRYHRFFIYHTHNGEGYSTVENDRKRSNPHESRDQAPETDEHTSTISSEILEVHEMTRDQRFKLFLSLWPYMIPLFLVYTAEYTLQSGTWTAIGFPVTDVDSRDRFYEFSNWMYQAGVFLSRSSGILFTAPMSVLWLMPFLQLMNVWIYWSIAAHQQLEPDEATRTIYNWFHQQEFLYLAALYSGLLGGAVYIHGYLRICKDLPLRQREFALCATSVAECLGIVVADLLGLIVQACLYYVNGLEGSVMSCPLRIEPGNR